MIFPVWAEGLSSETEKIEAGEPVFTPMIVGQMRHCGA
jgi:hypothetical protein